MIEPTPAEPTHLGQTRRKWVAKPIPENISPSDRDRFWSHVETGPDDACWPWKLARNHGYGRFCIGRGRYQAHRIAYALAMGPISTTLMLDHVCRNRACCNPAHLEPVTAQENALRSPFVHREVCDRGHLMEGDNLIVNASGSRKCAACQRYGDRARSANRRDIEKAQAMLTAAGIPEFDAMGERLRLPDRLAALLDDVECASNPNNEGVPDGDS